MPIEGVAEYRVSDARDIATYAVKPTDFVGLVPKLLVAEGDRVSAGDALSIPATLADVSRCRPWCVEKSASFWQ